MQHNLNRSTISKSHLLRHYQVALHHQVQQILGGLNNNRSTTSSFSGHHRSSLVNLIRLNSTIPLNRNSRLSLNPQKTS